MRGRTGRWFWNEIGSNLRISSRSDGWAASDVATLRAISRSDTTRILLPERLQHLLEGLFQHVAPVRIMKQRLNEVAGLLRADVRRQRRHFRIGDELDHARSVGGQRLLPGRADALGAIDPNSFQPDRLGVSSARKSGNIL